jgi:hypothetical protein
MSKINVDLDKRLKQTEACYNFEKLNYESGFLDANVDVTYIVHLENSHRYDNIIKQLEKYKPTKTVYILLNKGFGKCDKAGIKSPHADLTDCYLQIFKHAQKQNFNNILILEDDFVFSEKIKDGEHVANINKFLEKKMGDNFIYFLGAIPWLLVPYDSYNYRCMCSSGTHSVIYSKLHRDDFLENFNKKMLVTDWDVNYNINFTAIAITQKIPNLRINICPLLPKLLHTVTIISFLECWVWIKIQNRGILYFTFILNLFFIYVFFF